MTTIVHNWSMIASGLLTTLVISVTAYAGALVLGSLLAVCRVGPLPPLRLLAATWVTVATNVPVLCSMILLGLGIPRLGVHITLLWAAVAAVVFSGSGYVCEAVRSGINTVSKGQVEAARALGMPFGLIVRAVVLPQALAQAIQPLVNILIACLIGSSLAAAIGVPELTNVTRALNNQSGEAVLMFLLSGLVYLAIAYLATRVGSLLERRLTRSQGAAR